MGYPASELVIDPVLMRKYDTPGRRYTSYPGVEQLGEAWGEAQVAEWLARREAGGITPPLSALMRLSFATDRRIQYLDRELALVGRHLGKDRKLSQLHCGAATPADLAHGEMSALMAAIDRELGRAPGCGCSIEVDPGEAEAGTMAFLAGLGFNRACFGRMQDYERTRRTFGEARENGFRAIGLEVIYGEPGQTLDGFNRILGQVLDLDPDRIALIAHDGPASAELKLQLLTLAIGRLARAGYLYIGMEAFVRPDDELARAQEQGRLQRGFEGHTTQAGDLLAFGPAALGRVGPACYQDHASIGGYCAALDQNRLPVARGMELSQDDLVRAAVIQSLVCHFRVSIESIELAHLIDFRSYFAAEVHGLRGFAEEGMVEVTPDWIVVTSRGRLLVHAICMLFDRYRTPCTKP